MTLGERLCNPGNIRHVRGVIWQGQSEDQPDPSFVQFTDPVYGIRAIVRIMKSYKRQGLDTIGDAIDRWAPPNENNSKAYVDDVCTDCAISPDALVDFEQIMHPLVKAIIKHENGEVIYTDTQIDQGIALA